VDWLDDTQWLLWVAVAILAGVVEVLTLDLIFLMVAGGAFVAAVTAAFGAPLALSVLVFAGSTAALLLLARPPLLGYSRRSAPEVAMHTAALVGREAEVLAEVTATGGRVKLGGEVWSARADQRGETLEVGSHVHVLRIDGATAVVSSLPPRPELPAPPDPSRGPTDGPFRGQ